MELQCDHQQADYCLWQRQNADGLFEDINDGEKFYNKHTVTMTIRNFNPNDYGAYRCRLWWQNDKNRRQIFSPSYVFSKYYLI